MAPTECAPAATLHRRWLLAFCAYALLLGGIFVGAYLALIPTSRATFPFFDVLGHFVLLGLAALLLQRAWPARAACLPLPGGRRCDIPWAALVIATVASLEELAQRLSPVRTFDLADLAASLVGIVVFSWAAQIAARED